MSTYETHLQLPLVGLTPEDVWSHARAALELDDRVLSVERESSAVSLARHLPEVEELEHLDAIVRFEAASDQDARQVASALHDAALQKVLKAVPSSDPDRGWTSSSDEPVRLRD